MCAVILVVEGGGLSLVSLRGRAWKSTSARLLEGSGVYRLKVQGASLVSIVTVACRSLCAAEALRSLAGALAAAPPGSMPAAAEDGATDGATDGAAAEAAAALAVVQHLCAAAAAAAAAHA